MPKAQFKDGRIARVDDGRWRLVASRYAWSVIENFVGCVDDRPLARIRTCVTRVMRFTAERDIVDNMEQAEQWLLSHIEERYTAASALQP